MSKPTTSSSSEEENEEQAASRPPPSALNVGSVEDLERRLAMMGNKIETATAPPAYVVAPPVKTQAPVAAAAAAPAVVKGGKNALLARIMAAKEKQEKKAKKAAAPPPAAVLAPPPDITSTDMLMDFDAPISDMDMPPPSYETNFLKDVPPPAFNVMEQQQQQQQNQHQQQHFPPPPPIDSVLPPPPPLDDILPPPPPMPMPESDLMGVPMTHMPSASAPMFEDLHMQTQQQQHHHPPPLPPPMEAAESAPAALDIDESILNALEPAEREAFLEEQRKILEQIETEKSSNEASGAVARAMAFDQRSSNAVANVAASYEGGRSSSSSGGTRSKKSGSSSRKNKHSSSSSASASSSSRTIDLGGGTGEVAVHGPEKTKQSIEDGTAVIVKCLSCDKWMQVAEAAELMFCPICQVVCPVEKKGAATTADMGAAAQLAADAELAEKLQREEYDGANEQLERRSRPAGSSRSSNSNSRSAQQQEAQSGEDGQSWYDWLTGAPATETTGPPATRSAPTSGTSSRSRIGLVSARTGEEARTYNDESVGLMTASGSNGGGGARMAEQKSMFSCVADSINTAATQMYTMPADDEGNVHGVSSEGLLAMPDVSRQREN